MAQIATRVECEPDTTQDSGNASQPNTPQLNTETSSSPLASHLAGEPNGTMDPPDLSSHQERVPTQGESYQVSDSHNFSPWLPSISEEALLDGTQAAESPEKLDCAEPGFAGDLLDSSSWSTASLPRDAADGQLSPVHEYNGELPMESDGEETRDEAVENRRGKTRRSSTVDQQADTERQRRMLRIIRNLEHFENEQRLYGKQQLKAIKDGSA